MAVEPGASGWRTRAALQASRIGATRLQAPVLLDALLIATWLAGRVLEIPMVSSGAVVLACAVALVWPATGAGMMALVILFPGSRAPLGALLVAATGVGILLAAAGAHLRGSLVVAFAVAVVAATGVALLRLLLGPLADDVPNASLRWSGLVIGFATLPIFLFLLARDARRPAAVLAAGVAAALLIGIFDGLLPGVLSGTPFGGFVSNAESGRATGPFPSPNRLGNVAGIALVATLAWLLHAGFRRRPWAAVVLVIPATALLLSFSRGAILGVVVAAVVLVARRSRVAAVVTVGTGVVLLFFVAPAFMSFRLGPDPIGTLPQIQAAEDAGRIDAWMAGLRMWADAPLLGHGYGSFAVLGPSYGGPSDLVNPHNELIGLLAETGLPGALSLAALFATCVLALRERSAPAEAALGALLVFATATFFNIHSHYPQVTVVLTAALAAGLARGKPANGV